MNGGDCKILSSVDEIQYHHKQQHMNWIKCITEILEWFTAVALSAAVQPDGDQCPEAQAPAGTVQIPCQRAEPDTSDRPAVPHSASIGQPAVPRSTTISAHGGNRTQIPSEHRPRSNPPCKEFPVPGPAGTTKTHTSRYIQVFPFFRTCSISQTPKRPNRNVQRTFW